MPQDFLNNQENDQAAGQRVFFYDPRLYMTVPGRMMVRIVGVIAYIVVAIFGIIALAQSVRPVRAFGIFIACVLVDRIIHRQSAERYIAEVARKPEINIAHVMAPSTMRAFEQSIDRSILSHTPFSLELLRQLAQSSLVEASLARLDVKVEEFRQKLEEMLAEARNEATGDQAWHEEAVHEAELAAQAAFIQAQKAHHSFVEPGDVFGGLAGVDHPLLQRLFTLFSLKPDDIRHAVAFSSRVSFTSVGGGVIAMGGASIPSYRNPKHQIVNRAWTSRPTPFLDQYSVDLTDLARSGRIGFLIGHQNEYNRLLDTLSRPINPNTLLVGESGSGKGSVVAHLALALSEDNVPESLFDRRLVMLELANLVGSSAASGDIAARITRMVQEIEISGNIILYIPDIHNLTKGGNAVALSAADALIPIIMNNEFPVIGATYPREFAQFIEPRSDFVGAFEVVRMEEISDDEAEELLVLEAVPLERQTKVVISFGAIRESVKLGKKYFRTKLLPSSAAELLKEAVVEVARRGDKVVGVAQIVKVAEEKINVPIHEASGEEVDTLLKLEEIIHQRFIDQEEAVKAVARALREYRSGLARKKGPIASFLFVGPTGVGKTELAKILADIQFGSESMMLRFDMSEYKDKQSFFRFIGSPDRQVSGALSDAILQKPYSLVLLDEFEKAYPEILDVFLQVLDDGRLTDNMGRIVDFSNTIIIATSNAHADIVNEALQKGESVAQLSDYLKRRLTDIFKPELLNRFSQIVVFKNLSPDDLAQVTRLSLKEFESLLKEQDITIVFSDDAIRRLAKLGYDPVFGARPLRQVINDQLRAPLSEKILKKEIGRGSRLSVSVAGETFVFTDESVKRA